VAMSAYAQIRQLKPGEELVVDGKGTTVRYYCRGLIGAGWYETAELSPGRSRVRYLPEPRKPLIKQERFAPILALQPGQFAHVDAAQLSAKMIHQFMLTHRPKWRFTTRTLGDGKRAVMRWK